MSSGVPPKGVDGLILRIKRGESAPYGFLRRMVRTFLNPTPPRLPALLKPVARAVYELRFVAIVAVRWLLGLHLGSSSVPGTLREFREERLHRQTPVRQRAR